MASESTQRRMAAQTVSLDVLTNGLPEILEALRKGDFVFMHNGKIERLFHNHMMYLPTGGCSSRTKFAKDPLENLPKDTRLISVDLTVHPKLLNLSVWPEKISMAGYGECRCSLKDRVDKVLPVVTWTYIDGVMYS